jgi:drug/metabolite transporter (DMT)-like permease
MKKSRLTKTVVIFAVLAIVGVLMVALPQGSSVEIVLRVLPLLGAAIFSSALTFFLVEMFRINEQ